MKIFLDDERPCPEGWVPAKKPTEVIAALNLDLMAQTNNIDIDDPITDISLDHDLGDDKGIGTGYEVLLWVEEKVIMEGFTPPNIVIHSANSSARERMLKAVESIRQRVKDNPLGWK